ncbi:MAG: AAA family ATPase [Bacilli bacterium]|nr:AAA family ATPase [Tissierellia bacterium]MDD4733758.1 AAA family ATPase [Bacilli bacterium]
MLKVFIGPNGFGKTTELRNKRDELIKLDKTRKDIIFLPSEIVYDEEMKDTVDKSFFMEYLISEILETPDILDKRKEVEDLTNKSIIDSTNKFNDLMDEVLSMNGMTRNNNLIETRKDREYKKLVKINSDDSKNKMGSGQKLQLLLNLINISQKKYVFLDEPENHTHPSSLNYTAKLIRELSKTKEVYVATHSPKLLSMLDFKFSDIYIFNDGNFKGPKQIDLQKAIDDVDKTIDISKMWDKSKTYYDKNKLEQNIINLHIKDFMESIFSKKVYIVEGINDDIFLNRVIINFGKNFDDYSIFHSYGKQHMFPLINIFKQLDIEVIIFYDEDSKSNLDNKIMNSILAKEKSYMFSKNIEDELKYPTSDKNNSVKFIEFIDNLVIDKKYDI